MCFPERYHVVQQLAPYGPDPSLAKPVLPETSDGSPRRIRTERLDQPVDARGEFGVVVVEQVLLDPIEWERIAQLLCDPIRSRCPHHVEVEDSPPCVINHDEDVQHVECNRRDREKIHRRDTLSMVPQESLPTIDWVRRSGAPRHVARDGSLGHVESQLLELAMDAVRPSRYRWPSSGSVDGFRGRFEDGPATAFETSRPRRYENPGDAAGRPCPPVR